jgi:hypothetical protein
LESILSNVLRTAETQQPNFNNFKHLTATMRLSNLILSFAFSLFIFTASFAQNLEAGFGIGVQAYRGDINSTIPSTLRQLQPVINVFGRYHFTEKWAMRGQIGFGKLYADEKRFGPDSTKIARGMSFNSSIVEIGLMPEWRPFRIGNVELYLFSGVSALFFNANPNFNEADNGLSKEKVAADKEASYPKATVAVPLGGGLQWLPNETFAIGLEASGRATLSDYIDGISQAANPNSNDHYVMAVLTVSKFFGGGKRSRANGGGGKNANVGCPTFR